jgi:hypothetical protein
MCAYWAITRKGKIRLHTFAGHVDVWGILVFAKERKMKEDGQRRGISGKDDQLRGASIEGLGGCRQDMQVSFARSPHKASLSKEGVRRTLVSSLLQLTVMRSLLDQVQNLGCESFIGDRPCCKKRFRITLVSSCCSQAGSAFIALGQIDRSRSASRRKERREPYLLIVHSPF